MEIKSLSKDDNKVLFLVKGSSAFFINTLRRVIIEEVPTLAIEDVEFKDNSSASYDEIIAHRLGLVPITTDLKSYTLPRLCSCKGKGCAKCQLKMTLKVKGKANVYASDIKSKDPKCKPVYPKMLIAKLLKGQDLELEATAVLGQGKKHIKWSPGHVYYKSYPIININKDCEEAEKVCPVKVFDFKKDKLTVNPDNHLKCHMCMACVDACPEGAVDVKESDTDFIISIESWGQLEPKEMVNKAIKIFQNKCDKFIGLLKKESSV